MNKIQIIATALFLAASVTGYAQQNVSASATDINAPAGAELEVSLDKAMKANVTVASKLDEIRKTERVERLRKTAHMDMTPGQAPAYIAMRKTKEAEPVSNNITQ